MDLLAHGALFLMDLSSLGAGEVSSPIGGGLGTLLIVDAAILGMELRRLGATELAMPDACVNAAVLVPEATIYVDPALMIPLPSVFGMPASGHYHAAKG
jgi:hypothetical protein